MEKPRILLAEDNVSMRAVILDMLADDYDVTAVCTGKELYTLMSERRDLYEAVICDVIMPHWNGDEAVKMAQAFGSSLPVIFISGNACKEEIEKAPNCIFLPKPLQRNQLLEKLAEVVITGQ